MSNLPTPHQEEKTTEALQILQSGKRLVILGSAGVGKTFLVDHLLKQLSKQFKFNKVVCSTPTHKALAVLTEKVSLDVKFSTIHSELKYQKHTDKGTGVETFRPAFNERYPPLKDVDILVIDEASMISTEMLVYLERFGAKCIIIFIGDDKQINPVGEEDSPVFLGKPYVFDTPEEASNFVLDKEGTGWTLSQVEIEGKSKFVVYIPYPTIELTEIIRQGAGNPIIKLSRNLPAVYDFQTRMTEDQKGFVYTSNYAKILEELAKVNGTDEYKYLAYNNNDVDKVNREVRKLIYGNPKKIELGESIIFDSPYNDGEYTTNQELKVEKLDIDRVTFNVTMADVKEVTVTKVELKVYIINGIQVDDWGDGKLEWKGVFVIHEDSEAQLKVLTQQLSGNCSRRLLNFTTRNAFLNKFAKFKYNHAITIHKSQGSTYKNTILNVGSIVYSPSEKEKKRLLYTAVTRASDLLILYNVVK